MISAILYKDFYKADHRSQYPKNTTLVYSNLTARSTRLIGIDKVVVFGIQYFLQEFLIDRFKATFFSQPKERIISEYKRRMDNALGCDAFNLDHISQLHDLGYLPLKIKALDEGTICPLQVPILTIQNTHPDFFWLTNFIETLLSNVLWHPITSATIANEYRSILDFYAAKTSVMPDFVPWQGHDFSMRGQSSLDASLSSGGAHLLSFFGTDTIASIDWVEKYYDADSDVEMIGGSVPATEHSVMCMGGEESELETYRRLIHEVYPKGIVSIVSDTWDYWKVLTETLPLLRDEILNRDGKVVIRPDSGDPAKIICGDPDAPSCSPEHMGTIEVLWNLFGGDVNHKGYKQLNPKIGCIYGDSITLDKCREINYGLAIKGFASTNMVYGIGSYTYQYVTRDTFGFAVKATYGVVNGEARSIFKKPKTDVAHKASAKGLLRVNDDLTLSQDVSLEEENQGLLKTVFMDGQLVHRQTFKEIREKLKDSRKPSNEKPNEAKELSS
jgi:nicotinamide phosphoribosyltransferase